MQRTIVCLALVLWLGACQGDNSDGGDGGEEDDGTTGGDEGSYDDPCGICPLGGYAVDCGYLWGLGEFDVCGASQGDAEALCLSTFAGVIKSSPSDNCPVPSAPWNPEFHIYQDPSGSGLTIIEAELLERIEEYPQDIYLDDTRLDWNDADEIVVSTSGALSDQLGILKGDVLLDVNGYGFSQMLDTVRLYANLRAAGVFELHLRRGGKRMTLNYRIE